MPSLWHLEQIGCSLPHLTLRSRHESHVVRLDLEAVMLNGSCSIESLPFAFRFTDTLAEPTGAMGARSMSDQLESREMCDTRTVLFEGHTT
jgi:hypothetical protein